MAVFFWTALLLAQKYGRGSGIRMPRYVFYYGIFAAYTIGVEIYVGKILEYNNESLFTYLTRNRHLVGFLFLLIIENLSFDIRYLRRLLKLIVVVLMVASAVTVIQVFDPYFFVYKNSRLVELMNTYYKGRLFSIYTWTSLNSVGFSFLSMLSIYYSINLLFKRDSRALLVGAGVVSFLVQARWIMLNFLVIAFQKVLIDRKVLVSLAKYAISLVFLLVIGYFMLPVLGVDIDAIIEKRILNKSAFTRLLAFELFANQFPKQPIFGTGGVKTAELMREIAGRSSQIHVGYLSLLYYYGIIGGTIYVLFLYEIMKRLRSVAMKTSYWGTYFAFLAFLIANLTLVNLDLYEHGLLLTLTVHKFFERQAIDQAIQVNSTEEKEAPTVEPAYG
ncbi:MAG: hypothetical protein AAF388_04610 [Bacteroidota bacterium]